MGVAEIVRFPKLLDSIALPEASRLPLLERFALTAHETPDVHSANSTAEDHAQWE
jgi:hypothetical protein